MHPARRLLPAVLLPLLLAAAPAQAEIQYITDSLSVQLRNTPASDGKLLPVPVRSGNPVEVLQRSPDDKWARVRFQQTEGWLAASYLQKEQSAHDRLLELQGRHDALVREHDTAAARLKELDVELQTLRAGQAQLQEERDTALRQLGELKLNAAGPTQLAASNRSLGEKATLLAIENEKLQVEVDRLRHERSADFLLYGVLGALACVVAGWVMARSGRRSSGW